MFGLVATSRDYSRRARHRLLSAAEGCFGDRRKELEFVLGMRDDDEDIRYGKSPGRPAKSGLC